MENNQVGINVGRDVSSKVLTINPSATQNILYNNNFINNTKQAIDWNWLGTNYWDNGEEGNYWSDYKGTDSDGDGIGDMPHSLVEVVPRYAPSYQSTDPHPLMEPFNISSLKLDFPDWVYPILGTPPQICITSPQNITYSTTTVCLNFTTSKEPSWTGYSLDGQNNMTLTETTINLTGLTEGSHNITIYATDIFENTGASETITFNITKEPELSQLEWTLIALVAAIGAVVAASVSTYRRKTRQNQSY
jgi:hypothetical protein